MDLKKFVRDIPDFPKPGVIFKDITPLLKEPLAFRYVIDCICDEISDLRPNSIWAVESRGFVFGAAIAYKMGIAFIPVRKKGKLPYKTAQVEYELEYGTDMLEVHVDAADQADKVVIIDDVLATGGTASAVIDLAQNCGATVFGVCFVIELSFLNGRSKLPSDMKISSLITY